MSAPKHLAVTVAYDDENRIWFVEETDLPGLCVEAATLDALREVIDDVAPDLLETNVPSHQRDWPPKLLVNRPPRPDRSSAYSLQ
jgi:predicted RNase H-like HicB family nuclease